MRNYMMTLMICTVATVSMVGCSSDDTDISDATVQSAVEQGVTDMQKLQTIEERNEKLIAGANQAASNFSDYVDQLVDNTEDAMDTAEKKTAENVELRRTLNSMNAEVDVLEQSLAETITDSRKHRRTAKEAEARVAAMEVELTKQAARIKMLESAEVDVEVDVKVDGQKVASTD